jgi:pimeloyl-ACP methyl ester carboxylesterase
MSQKPTLVFVPGAWHSANVWNKVTSILEAQGYKCISVTLPTTISDPTKSFKDDFQAVRDAIVSETSQKHDVVVVMHSYGGAVGVSAIKGLTAPKQEAATPTLDHESSGHVIGIAMMATGFGPSGTTFLEALGGVPPPAWKLNYETGFADLVVDAREGLYHDLPEEEGDLWVSRLLKQSLKALTEGSEYTYAGWMDVPAWYLGTTDDKALPFQAQQYFLQVAKDAGADVTAREIDSSHSPMLSKPKETADFIMEAAAAFAK